MKIEKENQIINNKVYKKKSSKVEISSNVSIILDYELDCRACGRGIMFNFIEYKERYCDVECIYCKHINKVDTLILWEM